MKGIPRIDKQSRPAALVEEVFGLLFAACEISKLDEKQKQQYENDMTTEMDKLNIQYTRDLRMREQGREEGRKEERRELAG